MTEGQQTEKLQKVLASRGLGSRRALEKWITAGRVSVNGSVASLGDRVAASDQIEVDGRVLVERPQRHRHILFNKREGQICSRSDPEHANSVFDHLPGIRGQRWVSVGRLDINSAGLLIFTTDGELASRLMHPRHMVEREYAVRTRGELSAEQIQALKAGVMIDGVSARFTDVQKGRGAGSNHWYYVVLMEGRNREVRCLMDSQGIAVSRLKRVRYGNVFMASTVRAGHWGDLSAEDISGLYQSVGLKQTA